MSSTTTRTTSAAITDDRPFFWHFTPFDDVIQRLRRSRRSVRRRDRRRRAGAARAARVAIVLAAVFLLGPFLLIAAHVARAARQGDRRRRSSRILGLAFIALRDHADPAVLAVPRLPDVLADGHADGDPAVHRRRRAGQRRAGTPRRARLLAVLAVAIVVPRPVLHVRRARARRRRCSTGRASRRSCVVVAAVRAARGVPRHVHAARDHARRRAATSTPPSTSPGDGRSTGSSR